MPHASNPPHKITKLHIILMSWVYSRRRGANYMVAVPFGCTLVVLFMAGAQISRRTARRPSFHQNTRGSNQHVRLTHKSDDFQTPVKLFICPPLLCENRLLNAGTISCWQNKHFLKCLYVVQVTNTLNAFLRSCHVDTFTRFLFLIISGIHIYWSKNKQRPAERTQGCV